MVLANAVWDNFYHWFHRMCQLVFKELDVQKAHSMMVLIIVRNVQTRIGVLTANWETLKEILDVQSAQILSLCKSIRKLTGDAFVELVNFWTQRPINVRSVQSTHPLARTVGVKLWLVTIPSRLSTESANANQMNMLMRNILVKNVRKIVQHALISTRVQSVSQLSHWSMEHVNVTCKTPSIMRLKTSVLTELNHSQGSIMMVSIDSLLVSKIIVIDVQKKGQTYVWNAPQRIRYNQMEVAHVTSQHKSWRMASVRI